MRLDRGNRVEVLIKKKLPSGVWRSAEIVADNKDSYTVRYYRRAGGSEVVEKMPVEAVRPCPPPMTGPVIWSVGDVVEVFDDYCWKTAIIQEDVGDGYYYIHVLGSIDEFRVDESQIRVRQEWKVNKWILSAKDSGICEDMFSRMLKKAQMQQEADVTAAQEVLEADLKSKTLKRSSPGLGVLYPDNACTKSVHKRRAVEDEIKIRDSYSFIGKVENSSYQRVNWVKDCGQTLTKNFADANSRNHDVVEFLARTLEPDDCGSTMSSVGSCSTIYNVISDRLQSHSSSSCSQHSNSLRSDAESCQRLVVEEGLAARHSKEDYALRNHDIELSTYRSTLESFYVCGPLSWEQEALLTNLRLKLYVSNDEHLMELRRLKSIGSLGLTCH